MTSSRLDIYRTVLQQTRSALLRRDFKSSNASLLRASPSCCACDSTVDQSRESFESLVFSLLGSLPLRRASSASACASCLSCSSSSASATSIASAAVSPATDSRNRDAAVSSWRVGSAGRAALLAASRFPISDVSFSQASESWSRIVNPDGW